MFRRLSPVTEPNREPSGRPNAAPLSQILQPSPQSHAVPLSRILASQSPLRRAPVDGGLHASAAPLGQILASPSPLLHHLPPSPSPLLQRFQESQSRLLQHSQELLSPVLQRFQESPSPFLHHLPPSPSPLLQRLHESPTRLLQHSQELPSPVLQHCSTPPVRQNARRSRTPPRPAHIPKRGPKRKAAADLNLNPDQLYVKSQKRHRYTNRRKAKVLSFWLEETPRVIRSGRPAPRGECHHRTLKEVAEHTKIPLGTVKQWALKKNREKIFSTRAGLRCVQSGKAKWSRLERRLYGEFLALRERARAVRLSWFRQHSKIFCKECYLLDQYDCHFTTGIIHITLSRGMKSKLSWYLGWFLNFLHRCRISIRRPTNKGKKLPQDYRRPVTNFLRFCRRNSHPDHRAVAATPLRADVQPYVLFPELPPPSGQTFLPDLIGTLFPGLICNMDQTPMPFEFLTDRTYVPTGTDAVQIKCTHPGWEKRQATLMLTVFADGVACIPPIIIFHGLSDSERQQPRNSRQQRIFEAESARYHPGVVVIFNSKAYCNEEVMFWWIKEFLVPATEGSAAGLAPHERQPSLFALDAVAFHRTSGVKSELKRYNIIPAVIPAGCTSQLQPLDVCINSPFKRWLQDYMDEKLVEIEDAEESAIQNVHPLSADSAIGERRVLVTEAVGEVWRRFTNDPMKRDLMIRSFQKTGLALPVDGFLDHLLSMKGFDSDNPVVIGDFSSELQVDGSERSLPDNILYTQWEDAELDVSAPIEVDPASGTIVNGDEDVEYVAQVEEWEYTFRGTRTRPQQPRIIGGVPYDSDEEGDSDEEDDSDSSSDGSTSSDLSSVDSNCECCTQTSRKRRKRAIKDPETRVKRRRK
jgi:hypothetical protein